MHILKRRLKLQKLNHHKSMKIHKINIMWSRRKLAYYFASPDAISNSWRLTCPFIHVFSNSLINDCLY